MKQNVYDDIDAMSLPISFACREGDLNLMKKLKNLGAETGMELPPQTLWSFLPDNLITLAVEFLKEDRDDIWEHVIFKDEVGEAFEFVCQNADVSIVKLFLKKGIRPKHFRRALALTILFDRFENFTFLIDETKLDLNFTQSGYSKPLALAAARDSNVRTSPVAYVRHLLCRGAKLDENALNNDSTYFLQAVGRAFEHIKTRGNICVLDRFFSSVEKAAIRMIYLVLYRNKVTGTFRPFNTLLSFISYHGIFMASGFELGSEEDYCDRYMFYGYFDPSSGKLEAID
eukprot:g1290.t1